MPTEKKPRLGGRRLLEQSEEYFALCKQENRHPSLPGLALALGFDSRQELERFLGRDAPQARVLRRAVTRVEEATVQSAFTKDFAASAKFILQNGFGYSEKALVQPPEEIRVTVGEEER